MSNKYVSSRIRDEEKYIKKVSNTAKRLGRPRKARSLSPASSMSSSSSARSMTPKRKNKRSHSSDSQRSGGFLPLLGMAARFALPILASSVAEPVLSSIVKKISGGTLVDKSTGRRASKKKHAEFIAMYLDKNPHHVNKLFKH